MEATDAALDHTRSATLEERFVRGEETAVGEVYRRYSGPMFATAMSLLGDRDLAADAVQQAFVQAWRGAAGFDPGRELRPWLYAITRRAAVDVHRLERRSATHVSFDDDGGVDDRPAETVTLEQAWQKRQVRLGLERLNAGEREVLQLAYLDQLTQSEISARLGIAIGTVKSRTARAQRRLAELLEHLRDVPDNVPAGRT